MTGEFSILGGDGAKIELDPLSGAVKNVTSAPEFIAIEPNEASLLGMRHYLAGDMARAEECFLAALKADPTRALDWSNLGHIWQCNGIMADAWKCHMNAMRLDPNRAVIFTNMGYWYDMNGQLDHAIRCWEKALEITPGQARAVANLGVAYLRRFDFAKGWPMLEARFSTGLKGTNPRTYSHMGPWNGKPCRKLAVWPEQGVGDQVLYSTLLPDLVGMGQPFVCEMDERLLPAFRRAFHSDGITFVAKGEHNEFWDCDAHVSMLTMAEHLRLDKESFIAQPKRLFMADAERRDALRLTMRAGLRIAISWRSFQPGINVATQTRKSAALMDFEALAKHDDIQLVTVQYGDVADEIANCGFPIHIPNIDLFNDIDGVFAAIEACDVVVTTSNVTAHFAGALGKPTYLLLPSGTSNLYYWSDPGNGRCLWYPSVRLVEASSYPDAIAKVAETFFNGIRH